MRRSGDNSEIAKLIQRLRNDASLVERVKLEVISHDGPKGTIDGEAFAKDLLDAANVIEAFHHVYADQT